MSTEIIRYPHELERYNIGVVRGFTDEVRTMAQDVVETMTANDLKALSAVQIGHPWQILAVKDGEKTRVLINPRVIRHGEKFISQEQTDYFPDHTFHISRYGMISVVYEDPDGTSHSWIIEDPDLAATVQRKIDYVFGSTPLDRLTPDRRQAALGAIAGTTDGEVYDPGEVCPAFSKREYFISAANKLLFLMGFSLLTPLFGFSSSTINTIFWADVVMFPLIIAIMIGYYLYAQQEAKVYTQCSSCQTASQIGVAGKRIVIALGLLIAAGVILKWLAT